MSRICVLVKYNCAYTPKEHFIYVNILEFDGINKFHACATSTFPSTLNATSTIPFPELKKSRHEKAIYQPILLITLYLELYMRAMQIRFFLVLYFKSLQQFKGLDTL